MAAWNAQPYLFNVPNGTLDLSGIEVRVRAHRRDDYITCMGGAPYDLDRLVRAAEPELGMRLSESLIKQLTGGERHERCGPDNVSRTHA